jgi:branched-chain amino acid transport system substrate-binding protein
MEKGTRKSENRGVIYLLTSAMVIVFAFMAISVAEAQIKLGVVSAWDYAGGQGVKRGAAMGIRDVNAAGGVLGKKIEGIFYDNKLNSDEAKRVTERLLYQDKVEAIVGFWRSELGIACQPLIMEAKKVLFLTGASAPILTVERVGKDYNTYKYTFSILGNSGRFAQVMAEPIKLARDKLGLKKVAVVAEKTAFLEPTVNYVLKNFADIIVYSSSFSATATDFSMEFTKAKAAGANNLFVLSSGAAGTPSVKQWYDMQLPMIYSGYNVEAQNGNFWQITEGKCDGVQTIHVGGGAGLPVTKKSQPWYEDYKKMFNEYPITLMDPIAYDAVWAWAEGVKIAGTTESDAVVKALESNKFRLEGVSGLLEGFDEIHNPYGGGWKKGEAWGFTTVQWQDKKMKVVLPENLKTADLVIPARVKKLMGK